MKGVSPGIRRSVPAGTAASGTAGRGSRTAARDEATLNRPSSALPRPPAATPRAAAPAPTIRKRRRSSPLPPGPPASPVPPASPRPLHGARGFRPGRPPYRAHHQHQRRGRHGRAGQRRHHVEAAPLADRGRDADRGEHREGGEPVSQPAHGQHADQRGERSQQHQDAGDQGRLVMRAEVRDRELLDRHGRQVDSGLADRDDRSAVRPGDRGRQLGYAQRYGSRQQSG